MLTGRTQLSRGRQALGVDRTAFAALLDLPFSDYLMLEQRDKPLPEEIAERVADLVARREVLAAIEKVAVQPRELQDRAVTRDRPPLLQVTLSVLVLGSGAGAVYLLGTGHLAGGLLSAVASVSGIPFASRVSKCTSCGTRLGWSLVWRRRCPGCGVELRRER